MPSVLFYVQSLLGIGHLQRSLRVAEALVDAGIAVTLVSGGLPTALPRHSAVRFVQLPAIRARDAQFTLSDAAGHPVDDALWAARTAALLAEFEAMSPDAVILEGFPLARRAFRVELDPLIAAVRAATPRPLLLCSVRDIVVIRNDLQRHRAIADRIRRDFDVVLVHGDPTLIPLDASFPLASEIAEQIVYTGYVSPPCDARADDAGVGEVVVSAGGGAAGQVLLDAALAACRAGVLADSRWRLLTGTNLPDTEVARLRAAAPANAVIERFHENLAGLLAGCRVSISQAGYNTVLDVLRAGARAVLVPFAAERETEQLMRARRLAARGAAEILEERELSPELLARAIGMAVSRHPATLAVDMNGARQSARLIAAMIAARRPFAQDLADNRAQDLAATMRTGILRQ